MGVKKYLRLISLFQIIEDAVNMFISFLKKSDTIIVSEQGKKILSDNNKKKELTKLVHQYHVIGKWDIDKINELLG